MAENLKKFFSKDMLKRKVMKAQKKKKKILNL
jgi:hypothetical protein